MQEDAQKRKEDTAKLQAKYDETLKENENLNKELKVGMQRVYNIYLLRFMFIFCT